MPRGAAVRGWDPDAEALALAGELGAVDPAASLEAALADAELAVVAAPIGVLPATVREVLEAAGDGDDRHRRRLDEGRRLRGRRRSSRFVGGHPIAGLEARGPGAAKADLFDGATWFLAPLAATDPDRHRAVHGFVAALGATPVAIDPVAHDALVAMTSHVPHVLANVVVNQAGAIAVEGHEPLAHAGGSLRDMTRIAGANPRIWVDIFLDNAEPVRAALAEHRRRIEQVEAALASGDAGFLARWIGEASANRRRMLEREYPPGRAAAAPRARPRPSRRARRHHAGARRRAHQHRGLRAAPRLARARRHADACSSPARARRSAPPTCSRRQGYGVVVSPVIED